MKFTGCSSTHPSGCPNEPREQGRLPNKLMQADDLVPWGGGESSATCKPYDGEGVGETDSRPSSVVGMPPLLRPARRQADHGKAGQGFGPVPFQGTASALR